MKPLIWTNEKPTAPGLYWWRQIGSKTKWPVSIEYQGGALYMFNIVEDDYEQIDRVTGLFAGPISEPEDSP